MKTATTLIDQFRREVLKIDEAQRSRDPKATGNEHVPLINKIAKELHSTGEGKKKLLSLLDDKNATVRLWAASATLDLSPKAKATLEKLRQGTGYAAAMAGVTLIRLEIEHETRG